jgi:hypothetical protein
MKAWSSRALSPELTARLTKKFPPGSQALALSSELRRQGFSVGRSPCPASPSIQAASINIPASGFAVVETDADVYWQSDADGKLVWTAGHVVYTGP